MSSQAIFRWAEADWLWALAALPLIALGQLWAAQRRRAALARFAEPSALNRLMGASAARRGRLRGRIAWLMAVACIIVGLARPQTGHEEVADQAQGVDCYLLLDVSVSMLAPSTDARNADLRLAVAKDLLQALVARLSGDRLGLVPFAAEAFVYCPITLDHRLVVDFLKELTPDTVQSQGTDLGVALDVALDALARVDSGGASQVVVIITDGEDQGNMAEKAAQRAAAKGVIVHALGIGSTTPQPIAIGKNQYLQDNEGKLVQSRLDLAGLEKLTAITGGHAWHVEGSGMRQVDALVGALRGLKQATRDEKRFEVETEAFPVFLVMAFALLLGQWLFVRLDG